MTKSEVSWDLSPMVNGKSPEEVKKLYDSLVKEAEEFATKYMDRISSMDVSEIKKMLTEYEVFSVKVQDASGYGKLRFSAQSTDKEAAQLNDWSKETTSKIDQMQKPLFLKLGQLVQERPELIDDQTLGSYKHYLERLKAHAPYRLSEAEERVIIQKDLYGIQLVSQMRNAWVSEKLFDIELDGEKKTMPFPQLDALRMHPDREVRRMATRVLYKSLADDKLLHGSALRSICADHVSMTKLRGYPNPMSKALLDQDVDEETVHSLLSTIENTSDRFREFLSLKTKFMGVDKLEGSDLVAPFTEDLVWKFNWQEARKIIVESFGSFDREIGVIVDNMFKEKRIDAANRSGKTYGAFCSRHVGAKSTFVLTSYNDTMSDLYTLAHELGHSVQNHLTFHKQTPLNYSTSSCLAEMGSIFGELLLTDTILKISESKEQKVEILAHVLGTFFYIVYYVGVRALFETSLYDTILDGKFLDADTACEVWKEAKKRICGDSVVWNEFMEMEWARFGHTFIPNYRYYNFSYSFAQLLVFALYELYQQEGESFVVRFKELLAGGNTKSVREHLSDFGFDITDPGFWELGAKQANRFLDEFKKLI
ncbi:MAG: M3 family metallopeptidase [Candidatus Thorarchaeota archaeon]